jgi:hypothetical protein
MIYRWFAGARNVLLGIGLGLALPVLALAQGAPGQSGQPEGDCMPSGEPLECADRCPTFETCYIDDGDGQLYYRVDDQRFDCAALDCREASDTLADYCCERGQFAPPKTEDGCNCVLAAPRPKGASAFAAGACLSVLGGLLAGRRWSRG